jgi:hypothetical protein
MDVTFGRFFLSSNLSCLFVGSVPAILLLPRFFQNSANSEEYSKLKILYREAPKMSALKRQIFFQLTSADLTF